MQNEYAVAPLVRREHCFSLQGSHLVDLDTVSRTFAHDEVNVGMPTFFDPLARTALPTGWIGLFAVHSLSQDSGQSSFADVGWTGE
jgi:hypothetical protein